MLRLFAVVFVLIAIVAAYIFFFRTANAPLAKNQVKVGNAVFSVEVARTALEKTRGLSFRDGLAADGGMFFLFDDSPGVQNFWMKDMRFAIDVIWIGGGKVLGFAQNAAPQPDAPVWGLKLYSSPAGTDGVLEVKAGTVEERRIKVGDPVQVDI